MFSLLKTRINIVCLGIIFMVTIFTLFTVCRKTPTTDLKQKENHVKLPVGFLEDSEIHHGEERDVLIDSKTSFIPAKIPSLANIHVRNRRNAHYKTQRRPLNWDDDEGSWKVATTPNIGQVEDVEDFERLHPVGEAEEAEVGLNVDQKPCMESASFWRDKQTPEEVRTAQSEMMLRYMDSRVDPCQDFYQYACGNWASANPIPPDKAGYDTFEMLRESLDTVLRDLLEEPEAQPAFYNVPVYLDSGSNTNHNCVEAPKIILTPKDDAIVKAKDLYHSCMNYEILMRRSHIPLLDLLDSLGGWPVLRPDWDPTHFDWLELTAQLRLFNNDILISEWVGPDIKNSDEYIIQLDQTSLGLPTRDYFLETSNSRYLSAYREYMLTVTKLLGANHETALVDVDEILQFETRLASITAAPEDRRNVSELYRRMSIGDLRVLVPQVDWSQYLSAVLGRIPPQDQPIVCFALPYIQNLVTLLGETQPRTTANYLLWRFVRHRVNNLDDRFQDAKQRFYFVLFGRERSPPRWQNCVTQVNSNMGMAVGSMFVKKYFDQVSKNDTLQMTGELQQAFREILQETSWLDKETRDRAAKKIDAMRLRIGYPDFILDRIQLAQRYYDVDVHRDKYFENTLSILQHLTRTEQARLGHPVNKTLWNTAPAIVNAYYSRNKNQIMFPAGILQPPFYQRWFPRSLNYGGIGVVIGHEITHGFDDKGRLFDKDGNLQRWWSDQAVQGFHSRAQCLIDQYSRYVVAEVGMKVDGINTQGENIADNGGIKQAFRAYEKWLQVNGDENETFPNINATNKQLFFLNFAQVWCGEMRPEATRNKLKTAVHSPGRYRVIGTLSNSEDFARVFSCPSGSPMNPVNKCSVW